MAACQARKAHRQSRAGLARELRGVASQFLDRLPGSERSNRYGQRRAKRYGDPIGPGPRVFTEELSAGETEGTAPNPVQVNRNDGNIQAFDDLLHPPLERQK